MTTETRRDPAIRFRVGQLVEVRDAQEILATLDERAELDALPFMPEMLEYSGRTLRVVKVATKLCDTMTRTGMRRMDDAVHLVGVRCSGVGHGGCQADCLIYWKNDWLRPVTEETRAEPERDPEDPGDPGARAELVAALESASHQEPDDDGEPRYSCQATEILRAAPDQLPLRDLGQYVQDVRTGNAGPLAVARALLVGLFNRYQSLSRRVLPRPLLIRGGLPWGFLQGSQVKTPTEHTNLEPGELVRIKSKDEIMRTLNSDLLNRGLGFDPEMARYCGRTARVARRVDMILDEKTGRMLRMKNPCIVLEGIVCAGVYNANCPRAIPQYWREIWLERVESPS